MEGFRTKLYTKKFILLDTVKLRSVDNFRRSVKLDRQKYQRYFYSMLGISDGGVIKKRCNGWVQPHAERVGCNPLLSRHAFVSRFFYRLVG